ncbi:MAG: DUF4271 domain-containing protein [Bacteroidetes bacterium]|nr:DUF4271 domain-containing protein [Bacteroidota bacterium]
MVALFALVRLDVFYQGIPNPSGFKVDHWFFWALLLSLALLVFSIQTNRHRLTVFFRSMAHRPLLLEYVDDFDRRGLPSDWGLFLAGFAAVPVVLMWLGLASNPYSSGTATLVLMAAVLAKTLLIENLGKLFSFKPLARAHNAIFFQFLFGIGMAIVLTMFVFTLAWFPLSIPKTETMLFGFLMGYLLYFIRLSSVLWYTTHSFGVYYILYLCTLELIPLGIFLRWTGVFI